MRILAHIIIIHLLLSCSNKKEIHFSSAEIEKIYFEPREYEVVIDFEENNYSIDHFIQALNSAEMIGECKFYPKSWVTIKTKTGDSTIVKISNQTFKLNDDTCYKIDDKYNLEFLNHESRITIESISDLKNLKNRGKGISTFGASKQKFNVDNPLKYFGAYQIMDTTEINEIQFLGQLDIMTNENLMNLKYENQIEEVISFSTRNERIYFGNQIGIGFKFNPTMYEHIDTLRQAEYRFKKDGMDYILRTDRNKLINYICAGKFIDRIRLDE